MVPAHVLSEIVALVAPEITRYIISSPSYVLSSIPVSRRSTLVSPGLNVIVHELYE